MFLILLAVLAREGKSEFVKRLTLTLYGCGSARIIVLMLFRLRMTIDDAVKTYADLSRNVFFEKRRWPFEDPIFKSNQLDSAITSIIQTATILGVDQARNLRMLNQGGPKW